MLVLLPAWGSTGDRDDAIKTKLAVQNALRRARDMMVAQQFEEAVHVLESELDHIDGSREYLMALRDAYRSYIQQLKLARHDADASLYQQRLKILDPGVALDQPPPAAPAAAASKTAAPAPVAAESKPAAPVKPPEPAPAKQPDKPSVKAAESVGPSAVQKEARALIAKANEAFDSRQYESAAQHFEKAQQIDPASMVDSHERWAYCKLFRVVDQLKSTSAEPAPFTQLEREVRLAMSLAPTPQIETFGKKLLGSIEDRRSQKGSAAKDVQDSPASQCAIQHRADLMSGWNVAETTNVRVFHRQQRELAEKVARLAEQTRVEMQRKWFDIDQTWNPRCDIYLHPNVDAYASFTKVSRNLPGHSKIGIDRDRGTVTEREIHLRCDDLNMMVGTLPHEATHVVLGGQFGDKPVPRWADEGMAVLTEPRQRIEMHLRNLPMHQQSRQLLHVRDLMRLDDYPDPQLIGGFYAKSVSLVDFLSHKREPRVFAQFVKEGMYKGYEGALKKYYGYNSFDELENDWNTYAFQGAGRVASVEK
jgi:tetratricopeptide (TPR) repeat protein